MKPFYEIKHLPICLYDVASYGLSVVITCGVFRQIHIETLVGHLVIEQFKLISNSSCFVARPPELYDNNIYLAFVSETSLSMALMAINLPSSFLYSSRSSLRHGN